MSLSTIISFLLLSSALLAVGNSPTIGYELSIYSATPRIFWVAIIFSLFNGIFIIASCIYGRNGKIWIIGVFQIIISNFSLVSLYALRGYILYFGRGDASSLVGMAKDVNNYGSFGNNFYPITSIFISQLSQLTNLSVLTISKYLPSFFLSIYILSLYCLSKSIIPDRRFALSSLIASTPIFYAWFSTFINHEVLSVLTLPLFFYFLMKTSDYRFRFFSVIFSIIYPFFHPITAVLSLLYLVALFISGKLNFNAERNVSISLVLISFVGLATWFIQQYGLLRNISRVFLQLLGLLKYPATFDIGLLYLNRLGFATAIKSLLLMISDEIIFYVLSLFAIYIIFRSDRSTMDKFSKISLCFIVGNLFLLIFFFSNYIHSPERLINLNFNMILTPPLVGYLLYKLLLKKKKNQIILFLSLILFSSIIAIFSLYPSPLTMNPNNQVTISDVKGTKWLIIHKDTELKTANIMSGLFRFSDLIFGCEFRMGRSDIARYGREEIQAHFGFTEKNVFPIDEDKYLVIAEIEIKSYTEIWKDIDRFRKEDFIKINFCTNVDKIYENGEFRSYFVHKDD